MMRVVGQVDEYAVVECTGLDAVRGAIGRESILTDHILVFRSCPMVHAFFVRRKLKISFYNVKDGSIVGRQMLSAWGISGFYQFSALCLESEIECSDQVLDQAVHFFL